MHRPDQLHNREAGFTLVETMMAIIILGGGLLALATAFAQGMVLMSTAQYHQIAKEKASEAIESVTTSRDTRIITWAGVRNISQGGVFLDGPRPLRTQGTDGLINTSDDVGIESVTLPGPDSLMGTGDDIFLTLDTFTREIAITDISPNLRQIRVVIRYGMGQMSREYQLITYISSFA